MSSDFVKNGVVDPDEDMNSVIEGDAEGFVDKAMAAGVENEKCVIATYRTSPAQLKAFEKHLETCDRSRIPLEWVIDIADEQNGWFYGTAYHYDDNNKQLHVMVPDKLNPTFDGFVPLDHRTVHLVECIDKKTDALFNKIVRDSVVKIRWDVEWYEESDGENNGRWIPSSARFLVRIANQLLVEDEDFGQGSKGFVMLTADLNLRLRRCIKGKGAEDFQRLIKENIVQGTPDALDSIEDGIVEPTTGRAGFLNGGGGGNAQFRGGTNQIIVPLRKIADMSKSLREYFSDIIDERERLADEKLNMAENMRNFILSGDLDAGMSLFDFSDRVTADSNDVKSPERETADGNVEEAWNLCNRMERGLAKVLKSTKQGDDRGR